MDIEQLYIDHSIPHSAGGHKHVQSGWVGASCVFCTGNPGYHLGYNTQGDYYYCWRCGWHPTVETLSKLLKTDKRNVRELIKEYGGTAHRTHRQDKRGDDTVRRKDFSLPTGCTPLQSNHEQYLLRRGFDPDRLAYDWGLLGTGPLSNLDGINYRFRIIIPIQWNGHTVSFQGRDVTEKTTYKYINCPKDREVVHLKQILYGNQKAWRDTGIIVEGVTDVWRFGPRACATFGIEYTPAQVRQIAKHFKRVFVVFDDDDKAKWKARVLVDTLIARYGTDAQYVPIKGDPGGMPQMEADHLIKQLI